MDCCANPRYTMNITQIVWSKVTINYTEPVPSGRDEKKRKSDTFLNAKVLLQPVGKIAKLEIFDTVNDYNHLLLTRAELVELMPWSAKFKAYWWSATLESETYDRLVEAEIICEF